MPGDEKPHSARISAYDSVLPPLFDSYVIHDWIDGHRNAVVRVVCRHVSPRPAFNDPHSKRHRVILSQQSLIEIRRWFLPCVLIAVCQKVFEQRGGLPIFRMFALKPFDKGNHHCPVEVSVFAVTLLGSAPSRVPSQIRVWSPYDKPTLVVFATLKNVSSFVAFNCGSLLYDLRIPGFGHPDRLRECSCRYDRRPSPFARTALRQAVKTFHMTTAFYSKPGHTRVRAQAGDLFIQCHLWDEVTDSLFNMKVRILKGMLVLKVTGAVCSLLSIEVARGQEGERH